MPSICDAIEEIYECTNCDRFTKSNDAYDGMECPYCHTGKLRRKKHRMLINWEW